ncbi:MAG TPA: TetR/AcrR family transcriptional regulator [Acidimicrobiales bacterium]|nr:TetR/AcrR family transcriptional regulator [Acidimicrobiales bacterium]
MQRAITRAVSDRYRAAAEDVDRIIEAAYRVVERMGKVDPRLRDILDEAGLSTEAFYRHFESKDELLLVLLADGRHRLAGYLAHRMDKADDPLGRVRAWIEGVLAQAVDPVAASRTRPFLTSLNRLTEQYPDEQRSSAQVLVELLRHALEAAADAGLVADSDPSRDALAVYQLVISVMEAHILAGTKPSTGDIEHLVTFSLRAVGADQTVSAPH